MYFSSCNPIQNKRFIFSTLSTIFQKIVKVEKVDILNK